MTPYGQKGVIFTDGENKSIPRPEREDFDSDVGFIRAMYEFNDRVHDVANKAFVKQFSKSLRAETDRTWNGGESCP